MEHIIDRVVQKHMPQQRPDGSFHPGVTDANMGNTDQIPVYIEDHSKGSWGMREDHKRRTVGTDGKEKDRFTAQLTVFKDCTKVRVFDSIIKLQNLFSLISSLFTHLGNSLHCI